MHEHTKSWRTLFAATPISCCNATMKCCVPRFNRWWMCSLLMTLGPGIGGIGVRKATDISLPAYIASVAGSHTLIRRLLTSRLHDSSVQAISHSCLQYQSGSQGWHLPGTDSAFLRPSEGLELSVGVWWVLHERDCCQLHHLSRPKRVLLRRQHLKLARSSTLVLVCR